jgi:hypothetical protein
VVKLPRWRTQSALNLLVVSRAVLPSYCTVGGKNTANLAVSGNSIFVDKSRYVRLEWFPRGASTGHFGEMATTRPHETR